MQLLEDRGQLRRIDAPVKRELEITEIADRMVKGPKAQNHALLFEHVEGAAMPVLINAFGTEERMAWALGVERLDELGEKIKGLLELKMPGSLIDKMKKGLELLDVARAGPQDRQERALPGDRRDRPPVGRGAADPLVLAEGRGVLHHPPARHHARPRHRAPERRHLPHPGLRRADARPPLADPQGRGRARARGAPDREGAHPGGDRPRRRPGDHVQRARRRSRPGSTRCCWPAGSAARASRW